MSIRKYIERPEICETFADHCERVIFDGQTLRIDLSVTRLVAAGEGGKPSGYRATASRLVLTPQLALQLHGQLQNLVAIMEKKGLVRKTSEKMTKQ